MKNIKTIATISFSINSAALYLINWNVLLPPNPGVAVMHFSGALVSGVAILILLLNEGIK